MDVSVDRKRWMTECLRHHHTRGFVADAGERFEKLPIIGDLPTRFKNLLSHPTKIFCLGRGKTDFTYEAQNLIWFKKRHFLGSVCAGK